MADYFCLDIGSSSIKVLQLQGKVVSNIAVVENPLLRAGVDLLPAEKQRLVDVVKKLIVDSGIKVKKVVISVPEISVYAKVMAFPVVSSAELASAIRWQADQDVPLPADEVELSWAIIDKPARKLGGEQMKVLVVATPKKVSNSISEFVESLGLMPLRAENEVVSLSRLFLSESDKKATTLIVDIGANSLKMVILVNGQISMIHSYNVGGLALSRALAQEFSLGLVQAEQYKRAYGLDETQAEGRIFRGMEPVVNNLLEEFVKVIGGYAQNNPDHVIEKMVLFGGGVFLKGFVKLVSEKTGVQVFVGNPFAGYKVDPARASLGPLFGVAMGLAIEEKQ